MSEAALGKGKEARRKESSRFSTRLSLAILILLSAGNIFLMVAVVPKFEQIYVDALGPDHPLPMVTNLIITWRIAIAILTACWPILGAVLVRQQKTYAVLFYIGIIAMFLQAGITVIALFMPMVTDPGGLGEGK
jgi:type II secretory pathway component PulF